MMRRVPGLLLAAVTVCLLPAEGWAFVLRVNQPIVQLRLSPEVSGRGTIEVENTSESPMTIKAYLEDWRYVAPDGTKEFSPPNTLEASCASWVTFSPAEFQLPPFSKQRVEYVVRVPGDARGGSYAVLFFETLIGTSTSEEGVAVKYTGRIGTLFFVEVEGTVDRSASIESLSLSRPDEDQPLSLTLEFANRGNVVLSANATYHIMAADGKVLARDKFPTLYTQAGMRATSTAQWLGPLPEGQHTVVLTIDLGEGQAIVEERPLLVTRGVAIETLNAKETPERTVSVTASLHNTGNFSTEYRGDVLITDPGGNVYETIAWGSVTLGPRQQRELVVTSKGFLPAGSFRAVVVARFNGREIRRDAAVERD